MNDFSTVKEILNKYVSGPSYGPHGDFWNKLNRDEFVAHHIFGLRLVEIGNGSESNLVKALRGEEPFGVDAGVSSATYRRMPPSIEPLPEKEIKIIEEWINDGCPISSTDNVEADEQAILDSFLLVSSLVTGFDNLDLEQGNQLLLRAQEFDWWDNLQPLLNMHLDADQITTELLRTITEPETSLAIKNIIYLWYTSALPNSDGSWAFGTKEEYFKAFLWKTFGSHPPAQAGGPFGYWSDPPASNEGE